jgi:uncharacterized protein YjiS (DUF1127 family)
MLFTTLMEIYRDWRRYNAGLSELSSLSDRELADIGISRADIYRVAWEKKSLQGRLSPPHSLQTPANRRAFVYRTSRGNKPADGECLHNQVRDRVGL